MTPPTCQLLMSLHWERLCMSWYVVVAWACGALCVGHSRDVGAPCVCVLCVLAHLQASGRRLPVGGRRYQQLRDGELPTELPPCRFVRGEGGACERLGYSRPFVDLLKVRLLLLCVHWRSSTQPVTLELCCRGSGDAAQGCQQAPNSQRCAVA